MSGHARRTGPRPDFEFFLLLFAACGKDENFKHQLSWSCVFFSLFRCAQVSVASFVVDARSDACAHCGKGTTNHDHVTVNPWTIASGWRANVLAFVIRLVQILILFHHKLASSSGYPGMSSDLAHSLGPVVFAHPP